MINRLFGRWETTAFGIVLLLVVALLLTAPGLLLAISGNGSVQTAH